jgi:GNAT superfamily N-acetyltransferase
MNNQALRRVLQPDPNVWWVACFALAASHRKLGVAAALLESAVDHARQHGAAAIEGHPVDANALKANKVSGSALFTGTLTTFQAAGFVEIARTYRSRPIMRRTL